MGDGEVVELLKIANGYLPRVRLEYDRINEEINYAKSELNSWKAAVSNEVRVYQQFVDRNIALKNREDELQLNINELEAKEIELQKATIDLQQHLAEFNEYNGNKDVNLKVQQEDVTSQVESSSRTIIFDTKDLF